MKNHKCFLCGNWYTVFQVAIYGTPAVDVCWICIRQIVDEAITRHKEVL